MRIILFLYFLFIPMNQLWSQSLDYARDVFFYDSSLTKAKDYYYQYSPLLFIVSGYGGKGLHVVIGCPEETSLTIAKRNIELEIDVALNRPYLSRLEIINDESLLRQYLDKNKVDIIILEEAFIDSNLDLFQKYKNQIMIFNGNGNKSTMPKNNDLVPLAWHFNYKMNSISAELIKIWHLRDKYRSFFLFVERTRNYTISFYKRIGFLILLLLVSLLILYGYYRRVKDTKFKRTLVVLTVFLVFSAIVFMNSKISAYQDYLQKAFYVRHNPKVSTLEVINKIDNIDVLTKVAALRTLTERFIDLPKDENFIRYKELITEKVLTSLFHEDERVRMWCLDFIAKFKDESLVNYIASKSWDKETSYLVRTRLVRVLGSIKNINTDQALLQISKHEKHPYVISHLKKIFVMRANWPEELK